MDALVNFAQHQGGYVFIFTLALITGWKKIWIFRGEYDAMIAEKERNYAAMLQAKDEVIAERQERVNYRDLQIEDRERETVRERERADKKEEYALRLLEAARQSAEIAAAAVQAKRVAELEAAALRRGGEQ